MRIGQRILIGQKGICNAYYAVHAAPNLFGCEKKAGCQMKCPLSERLMKPDKTAHFFLPPLSASVFLSQEITLPNITTPLPSMKATRDKPSQFLKVSQTSGCCGWKLH